MMAQYAAHRVVERVRAAVLVESLALYLKAMYGAGVQVVDSMPDMASLKAAAAAAAGAQQLEFTNLLSVKMYRTAVALLCKGSGKRACEDVVS